MRRTGFLAFRLAVLASVSLSLGCGGRPSEPGPESVTGHYTMSKANGRALPTEMLPGFELTKGTVTILSDGTFNSYTEYEQGAATRRTHGLWRREGRLVFLTGGDGYSFTLTALDERTLLNERTGDFVGWVITYTRVE